MSVSREIHLLPQICRASKTCQAEYNDAEGENRMQDEQLQSDMSVFVPACSWSQIYCECRMPCDSAAGHHGVECDVCQEWFHGDCAGMPASHIEGRHHVPFTCHACQRWGMHCIAAPQYHNFMLCAHWKFGTNIPPLHCSSHVFIGKDHFSWSYTVRSSEFVSNQHLHTTCYLQTSTLRWDLE